MLVSVRPRPPLERPSPLSRRQIVLRREALIEPVSGGPALAEAEALLTEFHRRLADLFQDVPALAQTFPAQPGWSLEPGLLAPEYQPPAGSLLLARVDARPVGLVAVRPLPEASGCAELRRLYVRDGHRGRGIARELLERAIGEARRLGYRELRLETSPRMPDAEHLYRQAGFQPIPAYRARAAELDRHYRSLSLPLP
ncbi:GNAT family N-acetyltransferase [Arenimonas fontis]|uniref:GNAT family N-acetyltransferase n=1 Tax=Arenimonas fontis TaxID=2608255 RepID=A0A5B2ZD29_9GAMM|nr:GNAT family N-acetyltransferase [Arenimonas fontis]KAA2285094.1 GNAT family N-acetyltransferase [Arenimonas fontis]